MATRIPVAAQVLVMAQCLLVAFPEAGKELIIRFHNRFPYNLPQVVDTLCTST